VDKGLPSSNTYRPTVRYDEKFRNYVNALHEATTLDRNQIMRLALYVLSFTVEGITILEAFAKPEFKAADEVDVMIPLPEWDLFEDWSLWFGNENFQVEKEDVMMKMKKRIGEESKKKKRREGEPTSKKKRRVDIDDDGRRKIILKGTGGISYTLA